MVRFWYNGNESSDSTAVLCLAGLDWNVAQKDTMMVGASTAIPGFKVNVRDTDGSVPRFVII